MEARRYTAQAWRELIKVEDDKNYQALNNYFINRVISDKNEYTGKFKNKNLVMIEFIFKYASCIILVIPVVISTRIITVISEHVE